MGRIRAGCLVFDYERVPVDSLEQRITELRQEADVVAVSPLVIKAVPDTMAATTWALDLLEFPVGGEPTWPSGADVRVAIVDTGVDASHPFLEGRVSERLSWPGDPGGDFVGHGTHVAGIVAADGGPDGGFRGIAPGVQILDAPVVDNPHPGAPTHADGVRWAVDNGADVMNMSFGLSPIPRLGLWDRLLGVGIAGTATETLEVALEYADQAGTLMVASGGNCGDPSDLSSNCNGEVNPTMIPAASSLVLAVAATTADDERASFSSQTEYVDLAAPGEDITSLKTGGDGPLVLGSGTSQAAPHASGALALLVGADGPYSDLDRSLRLSRAAQTILDTVVDVGAPGDDESFGAGRLDIVAALDAAGWEPPLADPPEPRRVRVCISQFVGEKCISVPVGRIESDARAWLQDLGLSGVEVSCPRTARAAARADWVDGGGIVCNANASNGPFRILVRWADSSGAYSLHPCSEGRIRRRYEAMRKMSLWQFYFCD